MFTQDYVVKNPTGLHARPASQLAQLCKSLPADIKIIHEKGAINPKGVLAILTAGIKKGTKITIQVEGEKEEECGEKIITFLDNLTE